MLLSLRRKGHQMLRKTRVSNMNSCCMSMPSLLFDSSLCVNCLQADFVVMLGDICVCVWKLDLFVLYTA